MKVKVELKETSQKLDLDAINTYTKGPLYCVYLSNGTGVMKFPLANIWRVTETY